MEHQQQVQEGAELALALRRLIEDGWCFGDPEHPDATEYELDLSALAGETLRTGSRFDSAALVTTFSALAAELSHASVRYGLCDFTARFFGDHPAAGADLVDTVLGAHRGASAKKRNAACQTAVERLISAAPTPDEAGWTLVEFIGICWYSLAEHLLSVETTAIFNRLQSQPALHWLRPPKDERKVNEVPADLN